MLAGSGSIRFELFNAGRVVESYENFFRSLRLFRGVAGSLLAAAGYMPLVIIPTTFFFSQAESAVSVSILWIFSGVYLAILSILSYLYFWLMRALARASLWAVTITFWLFAVILATNAVLVPVYIYRFLSSISESFDMLLFLLVIAEICLVVLYWQMLRGPAGVLRCRRSPLYPLFINENYAADFWPGRATLLRDFWRLLEIPVGTRKGFVPKRVFVAALAAVSCETAVIDWFINLPAKLEASRYDARDPGGEALFWLVPVVIFAVSPVAIWFLFSCSRKLRRYARKRALLSLEQARLADPRRPVLFLRSFGDDQVSLEKAKTLWLLRFFDPGAVIGTLEELLLRESAHLGPLVAIGNPSDPLPPLGAARKYCSGETWRETVASLMEEASLVLVGMGPSEGLAWEIDMLRDKGHLSKTVFILPPAGAIDPGVLGRLFDRLGADKNAADLVRGKAALALSVPAPNLGFVFASAQASEAAYELALRTRGWSRIAPHQLTSIYAKTVPTQRG